MKDSNIKAPELEFLNPNNYTEGKNPVLSTLFHSLINDEMGNNSDEVKAMMNENTAEKTFTDSLTSKQIDLYNSAYWESCSINTKVEAERFIFGFKFALMLVNEGFKL